MTAQPIEPAAGGMWFHQHAPFDVEPVTGMGVAINHRNTLEPDVLLLRRPVVAESHYADAGIPYYWRIEQNPVHVYAYELVDDRYELVADSAEELNVAKPFEIRLRVRDITP